MGRKERNDYTVLLLSIVKVKGFHKGFCLLLMHQNIQQKQLPRKDQFWFMDHHWGKGVVMAAGDCEAICHAASIDKKPREKCWCLAGCPCFFFFSNLEAQPIEWDSPFGGRSNHLCNLEAPMQTHPQVCPQCDSKHHGADNQT